MTDPLETLVEAYYSTEDRSLVKRIYVEALSAIDEWLSYQSSSLRYVSQDFRSDIALTFVNLVIRKLLRTDSRRTIRNLINEQARSDRKHIMYDRVEIVQKSTVDNKIILSRLLKDEFKNQPTIVRVSVLYLLKYPGQVNRFLEHNELALCHRVLKIYIKARKVLMKGSEDETTLPSSHTAKMLLLSNIYKHNPMALAILTELKDVNKFIQLCKLAEAHPIKMPTLSEFTKLYHEALETANSLERKEVLTVKEQQTLSLMTTSVDKIDDVNPEAEIVPVLSMYFVKVIEHLLENYTKLQKRLIDSIDVTDLGKVKEIYAVINKEMEVQLKIINNVINSINTSEDLQGLLNRLSSE